MVSSPLKPSGRFFLEQSVWFSVARRLLSGDPYGRDLDAHFHRGGCGYRGGWISYSASPESGRVAEAMQAPFFVIERSSSGIRVLRFVTHTKPQHFSFGGRIKTPRLRRRRRDVREADSLQSSSSWIGRPPQTPAFLIRFDAGAGSHHDRPKIGRSTRLCIPCSRQTNSLIPEFEFPVQG